MDFIEARELSFSQLNETIRRAGKECRICACQGQRFIAAGMSGKTLVIGVSSSTAAPAMRRATPCGAARSTSATTRATAPAST